MTESIYLAGNSILATALWHLQIVGVTGPFESWEIEVRDGGTWEVKGIDPPQNHQTSPFYNDSGYYASSLIDLGGRNPDDVWELLKQTGRDFRDANIDYYNSAIFGFQNSNTFAYSMLAAVGINADPYIANISTTANWLTGISFPGAYDARDLVRFTIDGSTGGDWFYAGAKNDVIAGHDGVDKLYGGAGSDIIFAGRVDGTSVGEVDPDSEAREDIQGGADADYLVVSATQVTLH